MSRQHLIFPAVAGAFLLAAGIVGAVTASEHNAQLSSQQRRLAAITAQVDAAQRRSDAVEASSSAQAHGAQSARVSADTKIIDDLVDHALSWDSDASYRQARASTKRLTGLSDGSAFMRTFLPPAPVNRDQQGNTYPYIDAAGLNSEVADVTVKLLSVNALDYSYFVLADVQSKSSDGLGTAVNVATLFVTVGPDGKLSKLSGYAATTPPVTSN